MQCCKRKSKPKAGSQVRILRETKQVRKQKIWAPEQQQELQNRVHKFVEASFSHLSLILK